MNSTTPLAKIRAEENGPVGERIEAQYRKLRAQVVQLEAERDNLRKQVNGLQLAYEGAVAQREGWRQVAAELEAKHPPKPDTTPSA